MPPEEAARQRLISESFINHHETALMLFRLCWLDNKSASLSLPVFTDWCQKRISYERERYEKLTRDL